MALDASIIGGLKGPQDPLNAYANVLGVQQAMNQNRLADLTFQQHQMQLDNTNKLNALYQGAVNPDGTINSARLIQGAASGGLGSQIPTIQKNLADAQKSQADLQGTQLKNVTTKFDLVGQVLGSVTDQASYEAGIKTLNANGIPTPNAPPQYDPNIVKQFAQQAMSAKDQAEQQYKQQTLAETQRHNQSTEATGQGNLSVAQGTLQTRQQRVALAQQEANQAKTPAGYRQTPDGNLQAIPGGPADTKQQGMLNQDTQTLNSTVSNMDRLATAANEVLSHPGLKGITGMRGAIPNFPGSDAANAQALLQTLKSQVGFGVLQDMRNNSKTGGALGAVSDMENKMLQNNLAALDKAQSIEQFQDSLTKIIAYADEAKDRMRQAYNVKHPNVQPPTQTDPRAPDVSGMEAELRRRGLLK